MALPNIHDSLGSEVYNSQKFSRDPSEYTAMQAEKARAEVANVLTDMKAWSQQP